MQGYCHKCKGAIYRFDTAVWPIEGFERSRQGGGQNHVLRKRRVGGAIWHERCFDEMMRERDGRGEQLSLSAEG